ncbi:MAG: zinc-binding dehydrogenase [Actinomycetia bacterium]|nr:zinc-binding dehydrogenase [Actinomycetes bacterium]
MQAIVIREYGGPEVLRAEVVPDPKPGPSEVVVELRASAVNRRDTFVRKGVYGFPFPLILGSDGAGIRRDTGEEVVIFPTLGWGDRDVAAFDEFRILGGPDDGTNAELIAVPEQNVYPKPGRLSWAEAAALPLAGLTAYRALFTRSNLRRGETVLVLGVGSGVATFAVSLARQAGARVLVTSSSAEKISRAVELGAEGGALYTEGDWAEEVRALTGGRGVDVVVDSVGSTWADSVRTLATGGRMVVFGATGGTQVQLEVRPFYFGQFSLLGTTMGGPAEFAGLIDAVERGTWAPVVDSVHPLAELAAVHTRLEAGEHFGKLVLEAP